jgi:hypothetical protein
MLLKAKKIDIKDYNFVSEFDDVKEGWQINVINTALEKNIIGYNVNFYPNRNATRGEIFNMARKILEI